MCAMSKPPIAAAITRQPSHGERRRPLAKSTSTAHTTARIESITTRRTGAVCAASPCRSGHSRTQWLPMLAAVATPIVRTRRARPGREERGEDGDHDEQRRRRHDHGVSRTASVMSTRCASTVGEQQAPVATWLAKTPQGSAAPRGLAAEAHSARGRRGTGRRRGCGGPPGWPCPELGAQQRVAAMHPPTDAT